MKSTTEYSSIGNLAILVLALDSVVFLRPCQHSIGYMGHETSPGRC